MSYGVMAFAVEFDALRDLFGRRDAELLSKFLTEMARELKNLDREAEPEVQLTAAEALRQLIMGETCDPTLGHIYAYLLEELCLVYDTFLDNSSWCPINSEWLFGPFDAKLREVGVLPNSLSVRSHLLFRGSPFPIPTPSDFPCMGYLTPEEVPPLADQLAGIDAELFRAIEGHDQFVALREWLTKCRDTRCGLLTFYH